MSAKNQPVPLIPFLRKNESSDEAITHYRRLEALILDRSGHPVIWTLCLRLDSPVRPFDHRYFIGFINGGTMLMLDPCGGVFIQSKCPWRRWSDERPELSIPTAHSPRFPLRPLPALNHRPPSVLLPELQRHVTVTIGYDNCDKLCSSLGAHAAACLTKYLLDAGKSIRDKLPLVRALDN